MTTLDEFPPLDVVLARVQRQVAEADATFQLHQRMGWNTLVANHTLLEGYDRLPNLGLAEVRITFALVAESPGFFRQVVNWIKALFRPRIAVPTRYRLCSADDPVISASVTATIRRDASGTWTTTTDPPRVSTGAPPPGPR